MVNKKISKNFNLSEFIDSPTATRLGYNEQFQPPDIVIDSIENLVIKLIQPIRDTLSGYIVVSSGYRCKRVNDAVGSKDTSQHLKGEAADLTYYEGGVKNNKKLYDAILHSGLEFDQLINEFNLAWVHVSLKLNGVNRKQQVIIK